MTNGDGIPGDIPDLPKGITGSTSARAALNTVSGAIPLAGGLLSAAAGVWSEREQARINEFLHHWLRMLAAEMAEKQKTILEITSRIDVHDDEVAKRIASPEYQSILRKAFRDWAGTESEKKREYVRNILSNAAAPTQIASDDVIKLFLEWLRDYSELHFAVIAAIYNNAGITRGEVWRRLGRANVREDSSDADLFRLLFRDLSTGGIVRQHRETDHNGNFLAKSTRKGPPQSKGMPRTMKSAFDDDESYELTALGNDFVHYAMTDVPPKLEFKTEPESDDAPSVAPQG
jgi:hypothetical protein